MINKTISCGTIGKCLKTICHAFTQAMRGKLGWWELFGSLTVANRMCVCVCVKLWWLFLYNSSNYTEWNHWSCSRYLVFFNIMVYQIIANLSILTMYVCMYVCTYVCMWVWDCVVVVSMFFLPFMHFCPRTMTTHPESINSDLQRVLDRRLRHTILNTEQNHLAIKVSADN